MGKFSRRDSDNNEHVRGLRRPAIPELAVFAIGVTLLAVFFQLRAEQHNLKNDGLEAFSNANALAVPANSTGSAQATQIQASIPDQSLWSDERIAAYNESLAAGGDIPLAVLNINRLQIEVPVYNGASEHNLNRGVARVEGTARVDGDGNLGIAGHRDGFFRGLKDISNSDLIELTTPNGLVRYKVVSTQIVDPSDTHVLEPTEEKTLTLVTCYPFYFVGHAPKRFIVQAVAQQPTET